MISLGVLTPHAAPGPEVEFAAMAAGRLITRIARVSSPDPTSPKALRALASPDQLTAPAEQLCSDSIQAIGYASTTTGYVIGRGAEAALMAQLAQRTELPIASTCGLGAAYFAEQGIEVVSSASAELVRDPDAIEPAAVHHWVAEHIDDAAQAVFIGGNGFRTVAAIEALEATLHRPVLTANQVLLWQLLAHAEAAMPIAGYGQLFTRKP